MSSNGRTSWTDLIGSNALTMDANGMPWIVNHAIHWAGSATVDPNDSDRVFVTSRNGIFATFDKIASVSECGAVGFGKAGSGQSFPTVFIWRRAGGSTVTGIYRSTDAGATWQRINDDQHQFGGPANGQFIVGDVNVFGRVYTSTAGLGTVYGDPNYTQARLGGWEKERHSRQTRAKDREILGPHTGGPKISRSVQAVLGCSAAELRYGAIFKVEVCGVA